MGSQTFESSISSIADSTVYGRKIRLKNISIIESAFCGQTFLWNTGLIPESDMSYTEVEEENTDIIHTTLNRAESPTGSPEIVWIIESMGEIFIHSTSEMLCYSFLDNRFNTDLNPVHEFRQFISNIGFSKDYLSREEIPFITLVSDPSLECLIEFICSQQMSMDRIHNLNNSLKKEFGSPISFGDHTFYAYPTLDQLSSIEEDTFRDLSFGYRSKYIVNTVEQVINGNPSLPSQDTDMSRSELHECLSEYYGVGDKIADCIQLYSYNHSVVPMDTWTKKLADAFEPDEDLSTYLQYQQALESHLRPDKEGVDQLFAYHLLTSTDYFLEDVSHL